MYIYMCGYIHTDVYVYICIQGCWSFEKVNMRRHVVPSPSLQRPSSEPLLNLIFHEIRQPIRLL